MGSGVHFLVFLNEVVPRFGSARTAHLKRRRYQDVACVAFFYSVVRGGLKPLNLVFMPSGIVPVEFTCIGPAWVLQGSLVLYAGGCVCV